MNTEEMKTAIQFRSVFFYKREQAIIKNITGVFPKDKITTLVGPSGAGKTTVLKLCNYLISATSGDIYINENEIKSYNPLTLRRSVGLALQQAPMVSGSVKENIALPLTLQNKELSDDKAHHYLNIVGLQTELLNRHINNLSGGQRQKLSIARTLINKPKILLLDEITSSLDQVSVEEIEELIKMINEKYNVTVIWITHDIEQARKIGDYVWIMMDGELVESGLIDLLDYPKTERASQFLKGRHT